MDGSCATHTSPSHTTYCDAANASQVSHPTISQTNGKPIRCTLLSFEILLLHQGRLAPRA